MSIDAVLREIDEAFGNASPLPHDQLVSSHELEPRMIQQFLAKKSWRELTASALINYDELADSSAIIAFLSEAANRYFLPAFLTFVISRGSDAGLIIDVLLSRLAEGRSGLSPAMFTERQRGAVRSFLAVLALQHAHDESTSAQIKSATDRWKGP